MLEYIFLQFFLLNLFVDALNVAVRQLNSFISIPTRVDLGTRWDVYRNQFERLLSIAEILLFLMSAAIFGQDPAGPAPSQKGYDPAIWKHISGTQKYRESITGGDEHYRIQLKRALKDNTYLQ